MSKILGLDGHPAGAPSGGTNINILSQPNVKCPTCGDTLFESAVVLKKVSGLLVGTSGDQIVPIQIFRCVACGSIPTDTLPAPEALDALLGFHSNE